MPTVTQVSFLSAPPCDSRPADDVGKRCEGCHIRLTTFLERRVMAVAQPPMKMSGTIIFGRMLPCILKKKGHLECFPMSLGPTCNAVSLAIPPIHTHEEAYKVIIEIQRPSPDSKGVRRRVARRREYLVQRPSVDTLLRRRFAQVQRGCGRLGTRGRAGLRAIRGRFGGVD